MKTSKIKEVVSTKAHSNGNIYHNIIMENGDKINIGKKKVQQVGWELTYEIVDEQSGEYKQSKSVQPNPQGSTFVAQPNAFTSSNTGMNLPHVNTQNLIVAQNSITNAVKFLEADTTASDKDVIEYAEKFYAWVMSKG
jgi:hypothetical protein